MDNSEAQADLNLMGGSPPPELLEALEDDAQDFEVEPDAWSTVMLFLRVQTQWRVSFGGLLGLDYTAVFQVMDRLKINDADGELFDGLQVMEAAVLKAPKD